MSEKFKGEKGPTPEKLEAAFQEAEDEKERIWKEIKNVLATTPDRAKAEKIVLEKYADLMDEASKKSSRTLREWLDSIKKPED